MRDSWWATRFRNSSGVFGLVHTGVPHYRRAAERLEVMRKLARGTPATAEVDAYIRELRDTHRRRPRLGTEFDRAKLP